MKDVAILAPSFFDMTGTSVCMGGGERYLVDLVQLLRSLGYDPAVYQASSAGGWAKRYRDIEVHGLGGSGSIFKRDGSLSHTFSKATRGTDRAIYFRMDLGHPEPKKRSIGVSHGIWWDYPGITGNYYREDDGIRYLLESVSRLGCIVANDTNMINWYRCMAPGADLRFRYIPNYVDSRVFALNPAEAVSYTHLTLPTN